MLEDVKEKINPIQGIVYKKVLNVFDENLDKLEKIEGLDSKSERFNLGKVYEERVESGEIRVFDILTRPEIEMLIVISEGYYDNFTNKGSGQKLSNYCKMN